MAGPTTTALDARVNELSARLQESLDRLTRSEYSHGLRLQALEAAEAAAAEETKERKELEAKANEQAQKIARLEERLDAALELLDEKEKRFDERTRYLEKFSDRGWQLWLAALGFGLGLVSLLVTAALQLKK